MFCAREQTAEANEKGEWEDKSKDTFVYCQKIKIERERSIDWVSPSLTAFRNAAKKEEETKEEREWEISKQANRKILSMRTKLKHRTGIRRKKKERKSLAPFFECCWIRKCSQFFYVTFSFWLAIMMMMMIMIWYK